MSINTLLRTVTIIAFITTLQSSVLYAESNQRFSGDGHIADFAIDVVDGKAILYLARKPTNTAFTDVKVTLYPENGSDLILFSSTEIPGVYMTDLSDEQLPFGDIILETEDETDAIALVLAADQIEGAVNAPPHTHETNYTILGGMFLFGTVIGALAVFFIPLFKRFLSRVSRSLVRLSALTLMIFSGLQAPEALGHAGHDHGDGAASDSMVDLGSDVFITKKSQFLIDLTTVLAKRESLAEVLVNYGHIIPKPQLNAAIISPQTGIIRVADALILGKIVAKGETLATLDAVNQIRITSPISGQIQEMNIVSGTRIESGSKIFQVTDTSTVWVDAEMFSNDLTKLDSITEAFVSVESSNEFYQAKVLNIVTPISEETRTAKVFLELDNAQGKLRIGSLAKITFSLGHQHSSAIAVPLSAILNRGGEHIVFIQIGPEIFSPQQVVVEPSSKPGTVLVTHGVKEGDRVVVTGNYQLLLKAK